MDGKSFGTGESALPEFRFQGRFLLAPGLPYLLPGLPGAPAFFLRGAVRLAVPENLVADAADRLFEDGLLQLALPDDDDRPTLRLQLSPFLLIAFLIPGHLGRPEFRVGLGDSVVLAALVTVPEATVDEHHRPILWQNDVRFPRQPLFIDPVAEPKTPQRTAQLQLRLRGRGVDSCHVAMALVWSECVWHGLQIYIVSSILLQEIH